MYEEIQKNIKLQPVLRQCYRRHYKFSALIFIVPPVALTESQVVILYFFAYPLLVSTG